MDYIVTIMGVAGLGLYREEKHCFCKAFDG